ncbi:MAG: hypothetical protein AB7F35_00965 [Acetobacteraceae bacterium]
MVEKKSSQELALIALQKLDERAAEYEALNAKLRNLEPDFPPNIRVMDSELFTPFLAVLDSILGDEIATYFFFETRTMKDGGSIVVDGKTWPIRTIDDVRAYVEGR